MIPGNAHLPLKRRLSGLTKLKFLSKSVEGNQDREKQNLTLFEHKAYPITGVLLICHQKVSVFKDRAWLVWFFSNSCKTPWLQQQKIGQCVAVICPMVAWKAWSKLEKVGLNCLKYWEYTRSVHTHLYNLLQAFCLVLVKIVFYLNKRIGCTLTLGTFFFS